MTYALLGEVVVVVGKKNFVRQVYDEIEYDPFILLIDYKYISIVYDFTKSL